MFNLQDDGTLRSIEPSEGQQLHLDGASDASSSTVNLAEVQQTLQRRNQELEALNAISLAVTGTLHIDQVLDTALMHLAILVPYDSASIALWHGGQLRIAAQRGLQETADLKTANLIMNGWRVQSILKTGMPMFIPDVRTETSWLPSPGAEHIRSWLGIPLIYNGRALGLLNLDKAELAFYTPEYARLAMAVASQISSAIENARLYSSLEERVSERTAELQAQMNQTDAILQNVADAIMFADQDRRILYVNPAWEKLTGLPGRVALNQYAFFTEIDETPRETLRALWDTVMRGVMWRGILHGRHADGSPYDVEACVTPIRGEDGAIQRFVSVQRDVTESRKLDTLKARFIADAAHDLRNPVTSLKMRLFILEQTPERLTEHLRIMRRVIDGLDALVNDLLMLSQLELGVLATELVRLDLNEVVRRIVETQEPLANGKGVTLSFEPATLPVYVMGDARQIDRLVINLVVNAISYTPTGGSVQLSATQNTSQVILTVSDTGIGISPQSLPHIFERFYRGGEAKRTVEGTGLGLAIVKEIADKHGGRVEVESKPGEGSTFRVRLPYSGRD